MSTHRIGDHSVTVVDGDYITEQVVQNDLELVNALDLIADETGIPITGVTVQQPGDGGSVATVFAADKPVATVDLMARTIEIKDAI